MKIQQHQINWMVAASTIAVLALLVLQVQWLMHSKKLIEEQFDNKVSMAMCMAVTDLGDGPKGCQPMVEDKTSPEDPSISDVLVLPFNAINTTAPDKAMIKNTITQSLAFYDIHLPFELEILNPKKSCGDANLPWCCSMETVVGFEDHLLNISFIGKTNFILKQIGLMLAASILLILFITTLFVKANQYLIRQKKIGERNKDFFNNMAHEFKTPLTNINLASNLLMKKAPKLKANPYIQIMKNESNNLMDQVERVLYLANLEKEESPIDLEAIFVKELFLELLECLSVQIEERKGSIELNISESLILEGDRFHLKNAFRNIIENAIKYAESAPKILISAEIKEEQTILLFKDNGIGIAKGDQSLIFEKFQRVNTSDVHNEKGFGLGLAYVKEVMELHKGFITVISDLNVGSRFGLHFPR